MKAMALLQGGRDPASPSLLIGGDVGWDLGRPIHDGGTSFSATYEVLTIFFGTWA